MSLTIMAEPESESEVSRIYTVLGHPLRRDIIKVLGEKQEVGFTELKSIIKVSIGTLYYNLDLLEGFVTQEENKRYILTPKGQIAYRLLIESEEKLNSLGVEIEKKIGRFGKISKVFFLHGLFNYLYASTRLSMPSALTILLFGMWITYQAQLFPLVILYNDKLFVPQPLIPVLFLTEWILVNIIGNLIPKVLYHRPFREGADCLLVGSSYAFLPSLSLPLVWAICRHLYLRLNLVAAQLLMLFSAGYSLCLLTSAISMAKGLRIEKAASVMMIILYLTLALALVLR